MNILPALDSTSTTSHDADPSRRATCFSAAPQRTRIFNGINAASPTDPANLDSSELKQEPDWPRNPQTECSYALSAGWGEELQDPITMQSPSQNQQHTPKTGQRIWQPIVA